jgi:HlyD family type I secretion membrane fusion protein
MELLDAPSRAPLSVDHLIKRGMLGIVVLMSLVILWGMLAPLSGALIAHGTVKVDKERKLVQHLEGGIVQEILVADGQYVKQGQPLLVIADAKVDASVDALRHELDAELMRGARLLAERDGAAIMILPAELKDRASAPDVAELFRTEQHLFQSHRDSLSQQISILNHQITEAGQEIAGWDGQYQSGQRSLDLMQQELKTNEQLLDKNFISKNRISELQRQAAEYQTRLESYTAEQARARQKKLDMELQIVKLRAGYMQSSASELEDSTRKVNQLRERLRPSLDAQSRKVVRASVAGQIVDLKVHTSGGVVAPGATLMEIVPDNQELIIEAKIPVEGIDELHLNMLAEIRLSAYQQRTMQLLQGTVTYISADRLVDEVSHQPYYSIDIKVDAASLDAAGNIRLVAGMPAEVYLKTADRTVLDYLLAPITQSLRRGMRET